MNRHDKKSRREQYGKVAVLMGGNSAERVVSLETGRAVFEALIRQGVDAIAIDARENVVNDLVNGGFNRVFIALHGRGGEDGVIQGALEAMGIPYTGSGVLGSALAMDKVRTKRIWKDFGLHTPDFMEIAEEDDLRRAAEELGLPLMVKPVHEGSSCGAGKLKDLESISTVWRNACQYQDQVMAERWIEGEEYTAAVLGGRSLPLIRLRTPREFYDYEAKYELETTQYLCPCGLDESREREIQMLALQAFESVGASGWGRVDLFAASNGETLFIEVNTIPGMTSHSLVPMAAKHAGIEFDELVLRILDTSLETGSLKERATA